MQLQSTKRLLRAMYVTALKTKPQGRDQPKVKLGSYNDNKLYIRYELLKSFWKGDQGISLLDSTSCR